MLVKVAKREKLASLLQFTSVCEGINSDDAVKIGNGSSWRGWYSSAIARCL